MREVPKTGGGVGDPNLLTEIESPKPMAAGPEVRRLKETLTQLSQLVHQMHSADEDRDEMLRDLRERIEALEGVLSHRGIE